MAEFDIRLCMENGERLARIETMVSRIDNRKPCEDCKNVGAFVGMKQNLRIINWFAATAGAGGIGLAVKWIASHWGDGSPF